MNILILNWRDIKNPKSGGAEILTHELAKRLVKKNHKVVQFSSLYPKAKKEETVDGVKIIRRGSPDMRSGITSVHFKAYQWYKKNRFGKLDMVIDEIHGVPFFTPLYVKEKKIAFICEYAGDLWDKAVKPPFNFFGKLAESLYPNLYSNIKVLTISESSKEEIKKNLFKKNDITVIHPGCSTPLLTSKISKPKDINLVFIARLSKSKGIEDAIEVVDELKKKGVESNLHIVGRGQEEYIKHLNKIILEKKLTRNIKLYGYTSEKEKIKLIDKCHFLIITSEKEGWGLTVHEANARGVPAVSYNINGVRDVIVHGENGVLVKRNNPKDMAIEILTLSKNRKLYNFMAKSSLIERRKFTWESTYSEFIEALDK